MRPVCDMVLYVAAAAFCCQEGNWVGVSRSIRVVFHSPRRLPAILATTADLATSSGGGGVAARRCATFARMVAFRPILFVLFVSDSCRTSSVGTNSICTCFPILVHYKIPRMRKNLVRKTFFLLPCRHWPCNLTRLFRRIRRSSGSWFGQN